jgi:hypothetical protein
VRPEASWSEGRGRQRVRSKVAMLTGSSSCARRARVR